MGIIQFVQNILYFVNAVLVPFILALAFLFFVFNAARYFIIQGAQEDARTKAKSLALWGILAFVFILSIWGIVNTFVFGLGFQTDRSLTPDYIDGGGSGGASSGGTGGYTCVDLGLGDFCYRSGSRSTYTPGSGQPIIDPNNPRQTIRFNVGD